jgi:hypothetical protein
LRGFDLEISGGVEPHADIVLDDAKERPTLWVPKDAADRLLTHMEKVEFPPEPAMVATLRLFETEEVLVELFLARPSCPVNALQLRVLGVAAPIGPSYVH